VHIHGRRGNRTQRANGYKFCLSRPHLALRSRGRQPFCLGGLPVATQTWAEGPRHCLRLFKYITESLDSSGKDQQIKAEQDGPCNSLRPLETVKVVEGKSVERGKGSSRPCYRVWRVPGHQPHPQSTSTAWQRPTSIIEIMMSGHPPRLCITILPLSRL
jgi:hypothetical protein